MSDTKIPTRNKDFTLIIYNRPKNKEEKH